MANSLRHKDRHHLTSGNCIARPRGGTPKPRTEAQRGSTAEVIRNRPWIARRDVPGPDLSIRSMHVAERSYSITSSARIRID